MGTIQTLINAIPDAEDGNVITADYHNTIKAALEAIAGQLGSGGGPQTVTLTLQPTFLPKAGSPVWTVSLGFAADPGPPSCDGFIPLSFPDGAVIQSMEVMGAKTNAGSLGFVNLLILPISGTAGTALIQIDLSKAGNPFSLSGTPNIPGLTPTALTSMQTVQNTQFKYVIEAQVFSPAGTPAATVVINALQVVYTTGS
jgi:hypothetical protein